MNSQFMDSDSDSDEIPQARPSSSTTPPSTTFNSDPISPPELYGSAFNTAVLWPDYGGSHADRPGKSPRNQRYSSELSGRHMSFLNPAPANPGSMDSKVSQKPAFAVPARRFSSIQNSPCKQAHLGVNTKSHRDFNSATYQDPFVITSRNSTVELPESESRRAHIDRTTGNRDFDSNDDWSLASASGSTTLTTDTHGDSDGVPESLCDIAAFDFPEPPPMGSPTIRRMRSAPWFMAEDGPSRSLTGHHCRSRLTEDNLTQSRRHSCSPDIEINSSVLATRWTESGNLVEAGKPRVPYKPSIGRSELKKLDLALSEEMTNGLDTSMPDPAALNRHRSKELTTVTHASAPNLLWANARRDLGRSSTSILRTFPADDNSRVKAREGFPQTEAQDSHSFGPLPRIIRKVASMKSDMQKASIPSYHMPGSARRAIPKARSFRSILQSSDAKACPFKTNRIDPPAHQNIWPQANASRNPNRQTDPGPYLNGKRRQVWHQHLSGPLTGSGVSYKGQESPDAFDDSRRGLARPFVYRSTDKNASQKKSSVEDQAIGSKSFIDITPVQGTRSTGGAKRERVKDLIARASNGILGWGKRRIKSSAA
ncbi:hypothetical protein GALMADRAFT_248739, partial [Galerina marginata CBS 339.88]